MFGIIPNRSENLLKLVLKKKKNWRSVKKQWKEIINTIERNDVFAGGPMAKMKYTEITKEFSGDNLSALKIVNDSSSKQENNSDLVTKNLNEKPNEEFEDETLQEMEEEEEKEILIKNSLLFPTKQKHHKSSPSKRKNSFNNLKLPSSIAVPIGYDNPSWTGQSSGSSDCSNYSSSLTSLTSNSSKSASLPSQSSLKALDSVILEALRVSPEDFASQLSLLDLAVFKQIAPHELQSCSWNKKNKMIVAPNVVQFTQRFNHVSFWTCQEILSGTTPKHRGEILSHFIKISKKLYELSNFHSLFAVISAMQSASVYRLKKTWATLTKKDKQTFDKLAEVFSENQNWKNLRQHLECFKLPCIPYLGMFLTDLVYIEMSQPAKSSPEQKVAKVNNVLRIISSLQESDYSSLPVLPNIQRYLKSVRYIDELQKFVEDDQYKLSLRLEPPSPVASSCSSSKESVSGEYTPNNLTNNSSPAKSKFVPGHRKSNSLGTKLRSNSLPRNFHKYTSVVTFTSYRIGCSNTRSGHCNNGDIMSTSMLVSSRHLLDDSLIEEHLDGNDSYCCENKLNNIVCYHQNHQKNHIVTPSLKSLQHLNLSPLKRLPTVCDEDIEQSIIIQGCLRRKTVLKDGRKPTVTSWQRYWVQLLSNCLVFYLPRAFKGLERSDYKKEPCKVAPMAGCLVSLSDNPLHPDIFHLRDPIKSNLYKFKTGCREEAVVWIKALQETLGLGLDLNKHYHNHPTNLISFE